MTSLPRTEMDSSLYDRVEKVLHQMRPFLQRDEGDVELIEINAEKVVRIAFKGNCITCPMSLMTLKNGLEAAIKSAIPEIRGIESTNTQSLV